ncbi:DNA repair Rad51-like protein [Gregarina niphandrodes]|uniref:DNA repair Rad51-like protein n=1 Tax=Gregarina niphandrodes TaxID=110365 RepID=A0A023AZU1_GRENI|nr:DNA repair Rad51-like protein [Gregarina niphandrodes]EZG43825.1 DNA repair Rad51-like protein [Gregarina niphandrodes]|eukprot:XP_011132980.1 DNA repair Rad51-like protein [Gregarina niphandrodes]
MTSVLQVQRNSAQIMKTGELRPDSRCSVQTVASVTEMARDMEHGFGDQTIMTNEQALESVSEGPLQLEVLLSKGFTHRDLELLREGGIQTVECIAFSPDRAIAEIKGISDQKVEKLKTACRGLLGLGFCLATNFLEARQNLIRFTTGSVDLDRILQGGIESGSITEIFGEFRTGKTQLCHTLAVTCQLPVDLAGGDGRCLWIDTEGTFRPERVVAIAERYQLTPHVVLDNIIYGRAFNTDHLLQLLVESAAIMAKTRFALVVIDSIISLYRSEFAGRGELASRQMHLGRVLRTLQRIADTFGVGVILTNQVMAKVDGMIPGNDKQPTGGHVLAHASQTRLYMKKGKGQNRVCKIVDSPNLPEAEAQFSIKEGGIDKADN